MGSEPPLSPRKGRGAVSNPAGRFEVLIREACTDGCSDSGDGEAPPHPATTVAQERARAIISRNASPDLSFDRSINPYRGCEHGCSYCYARPTHAYLGLSPGLDFETRLFVKDNAADLLERELSAPGYRAQPIMLGANTDPYQPIERERRITRAVLAVLAACHHPVAITTKSALVVRDIDVLAPMAEAGVCAVALSLTTLDPALARIMEPRASAPARRLAAIAALATAGIPVTVLAAPMIPFVNDHELERLLAAAREAGATCASYSFIRLPHELKEIFPDWLRAHFPDRAQRVLARIRDCRGGQLYDGAFSTRMSGSGPYAALLDQRFRLACQTLGLKRRQGLSEALDTSRFRAPTWPPAQLSLF